MAVVEVTLSVHDLHLLSEHVEISEHETSDGEPLFRGDMMRLDFAAVRIGYDLFQIVKDRKRLPVLPEFPGRRIIRGSRAYVRPPVETMF